MSAGDKVGIAFLLAGALVIVLGHTAVGLILIGCGMVAPASVSR